MMNLILKTVLSLSLSGTLLIFILLAGKRFLKNRLSRQWQYYIWLIVALRLLLPFGPKINLMGSVYQTVEGAVTQERSAAGQEYLQRGADEFAAFSGNAAQEIQKTTESEKTAGEIKRSAWQESQPAGEEKQESGIWIFLNGIGWFWLITALGMLIRKITAYQNFVRYVTAGAEPVSDMALLEELAAVSTQMGVNGSVELGVNPLLSSPTLTGVFRPCIVLPEAEVSGEDFRYIAIHELTHWKRGDIFYKWLVQFIVCLHWFNPFVHLMSREINNACEFSCDEAVLEKTGYENARDYGKTLLDTMAAVGKYRESSTVVTMSGNKALLKERLGAIMSCGEKSGTVRFLTVVLTVCVIFGAIFVGVYPAQADTAEASETEEPMVETKEISSAKALEEKFGRLDEEAQSLWLDKIYQDGDIASFSAALDQLEMDSSLIRRFAKKAYADGSFSFFSVLADHMETDMLEEWLDKAMTDQEAGFQSLLFDRVGMDGEKDKWEAEWEKEQAAQYKAVGVTKEGKNYYYQGQLVNIFLDMRPDSSFYTLNINPAGTVNVKIMHREDGQITGAAYLSEEEFAELFGDERKADDQEYPRTMYVNCHVCKVRAGAGVEFEIVGLMAEEEEVTVLEMVEGSGGQNWYRIDKESLPEDREISAEECYIRADLLREK